jgi:excinuclease ABC subunit A
MVDEIRGLAALDKLIHIDQDPIGNTPQSNPATFTGLFDHIRDFFARLPGSKIRGWLPKRFSFNKPGGRCEACEGNGQRKIEMHFLPDIWVVCEVCAGKRYAPETLLVDYKGKSISDVLNMRISEALELFGAFPRMRRILQTLEEVGLGYLTLGQSAPTLSGGEAQRVKLAAELAKPSTGRTLYLLDEPTTGLHFEDVARLIEVIHRLCEGGNTVVLVEHNLDVIKNADWVIDLGPEAGPAGGEIVIQGTPETVVAGEWIAVADEDIASRQSSMKSHTALALSAVLATSTKIDRHSKPARQKNPKPPTVEDESAFEDGFKNHMQVNPKKRQIDLELIV